MRVACWRHEEKGQNIHRLPVMNHHNSPRFWRGCSLISHTNRMSTDKISLRLELRLPIARSVSELATAEWNRSEILRASNLR